ncbi:golgin subfamily A member 6-like protein 22 [Ranitomeya imitator]|uniref:golgin subfamily A member 6-like protein 22 n=1 Tax=Ranitomeya imitator TaxID=111125 RepID=UPI0037E99E19
MGILQESELSENTISKLEEKPRKISVKSNQSPKAAQPSCLRGAFVRIFVKKTEPNNKTNKTEEDPSSSQITEDQEEAKGKKRKVTGGIFRLPCLRAAETTGNNDIQDKTEEQSNDGVQEEELKPYSKASFLRKIRCYRLMREKDSTEKEKVIEMAQRKHDRENVDVKPCKEKVVEHSEEGLQSIEHVDVMEEKRKDTTEQESQEKKLGKADNDVQEQECSQIGEGENSLKKEECCSGKLSGPGKESEKNEGLGQGVGEMGKDLAEQENSLKNQECSTGKLSGLLEESVKIEEPAQDLGGMSTDLVEQKSNLKKQECCKGTLSKQGEDSVKIEEHVGNMDKDLVEHENSLEIQECCIGKLSATGEESVKIEDPMQDLGGMSEDLAEQNSLKKQECGKEILSKLGEESVKIEEPAKGLGGMGEDMAEQKTCVETLKEKGILLEGGLSRQEDKNLAEKESQIEKVEKMLDGDGVGEQEKGVLEEKSYGVKVGDLDKALSDNVSQAKEVGKQERGEEEVMEKDLPKKESEELVCTKENTFASELESQTESMGNTENNLSGQQNLEEDLEDVRNFLSGQDGEIEEKDMTEQQSQGDRADQKVENERSHGDKESHDEVVNDQGNKLVVLKSLVERTLNDTPKETLQDFEDNTTKVSEVSLDVQDEQHYMNNMSNQGPSMLDQEPVNSETCKDSSTKMTLGSEDNESIGKKTMTNNIITCASSEEANTQVLGLPKEKVLASKNAIDHTYQEENILHTCVNDQDDGMGCENTDLGTLRVEVKDMVEWLVQEASDRLSNYADESEGTG